MKTADGEDLPAHLEHRRLRGPNGNSSTAPDLARQRRRSPAAVTPASVARAGRRRTTTLGTMDPSAAEHAAGRRAALTAARSLRTRARNDLRSWRSSSGTIPSAEEARSFGDDLGPFAAVAYIPLFALANFVVAWGILAGAGGLLFGTARRLAARARRGHARGARPDGRGAPAGQGPRRQAPAERVARPRGLPPAQRHGRGDGVADRARSCPTGWSTTPWGSPGSATARWRSGPSIGAAPKVFAYVALGGSINEPLGGRGEGRRGAARGARESSGSWWSGAQMAAEAASAAREPTSRRCASTRPSRCASSPRCSWWRSAASARAPRRSSAGPTASAGSSSACSWPTGRAGGIFPWPLLAATVSPLGPVGSTVGPRVPGEAASEAESRPGSLAAEARCSR